MSANQKTRYYWSEDTITHFQFTSNYLNEMELLSNIEEFIELNCDYYISEDPEDDFRGCVEDLWLAVTGEIVTIEDI